MTTYRRDRDSGFSLIELIVVVGILSILIAIAVPTFLQARIPAQNRQSQALLRYGLTAGREIYADGGTYAGVTAGDLTSAEGSVQWRDDLTSAYTGSRQVSVKTGTLGAETYLLLATRSASGDCFAVLHADLSPTRFQRTSSPATCAAGDFDPTVGWQDHWP